MADRSGGTICFFGKINKSHYKKCEELCECLIEGELDKDGLGYFSQCTPRDFEELIAFCIENDIKLRIQWAPTYDSDGRVEYYSDGQCRSLVATSDGDACLPISYLRERKDYRVEDIIDGLFIPELTSLEIVEDPKPSMRTITVYYSDGDTTTSGINGTDEAICKYFLGKRFEIGFGEDAKYRFAILVRCHDNDKRYGLRVRNIENNCIRKIIDVRLEEEESGRKAVWLKVSDTEYDSYDCWFYDQDGNWIEGVGYPHPTV